jgi:hypothetical protein
MKKEQDKRERKAYLRRDCLASQPACPSVEGKELLGQA